MRPRAVVAIPPLWESSEIWTCVDVEEVAAVEGRERVVELKVRMLLCL